MRLLILGGTRFVGRALAEAASAAGWDVTTFNRGRSGPDVPGVKAVRGDRCSVPDLAKLAALGPWDAAVDTSGYVPRQVLATSRSLVDVVGRYVFMSTVSVYRDWPIEPLSEASTVLECPPDAGPDYGDDSEDGPTRYGYQKAGCETAVQVVFGSRSLSLRPGVVLGPWEYVGRLPWWLNRVARGGEVLAPGAPGRTIQPVDVRDLAAFTLRAVETQLSGALNVAAPVDFSTFGNFLNACIGATESNARLNWISDSALLEFGVRQWSEIPLWRTYSGTWQVDSSAAQSSGLSCRSLDHTVADTWAWMRREGVIGEDERAAELGIAAEKERHILAAAR